MTSLDIHVRATAVRASPVAVNRSRVLDEDSKLEGAEHTARQETQAHSQAPQKSLQLYATCARAL